MKNKLSIFLILALVSANPVFAEYAFSQSSDFTGESFFEPPLIEQKSDSFRSSYDDGEDEEIGHGTIAPIKLLRLKMRDRAREKDLLDNSLAPTGEDSYMGEIETSEYVSKEVEDNFDENIQPDGFDAEEELVQEEEKTKKSLFKKKKNKKVNNEDADDIILDCDKVDYDTPNYLVKAKGNVRLVNMQ